MKRCLTLLVSVLAMSGTACADDGLRVTASQPGPMAVRLTGPDNVVAIAGKGFDGVPMGGCTYSIDWGDGTTAPASIADGPPYCRSDLTHVYAAPGEYTTTVGTYDIGPADGPENQREGKIKVTVR